jgi:hypothetical protein
MLLVGYLVLTTGSSHAGPSLDICQASQAAHGASSSTKYSWRLALTPIAQPIDHLCLFIDSDSVLVKPFDPADWVFEDDPILDYPSYASINEHYRKTGYGGFGVNIWRKGVSHTLGATVDREFSRKLEQCYRVEWFKPMREHIEHEHNMSFKSFMGQQKGTGMDGKNIKEDYFFSDFNYMGAFLWEKYRNPVCWLDTDITGYWSTKKVVYASDPRYFPAAVAGKTRQ